MATTGLYASCITVAPHLAVRVIFLLLRAMVSEPNNMALPSWSTVYSFHLGKAQDNEPIKTIN